MTKALEGRVALVTGSGQGIGRGVAIYLAREGANISIVQYGVTTDSTNGAYSKCPSIYQELCPLPGFAGNRPVVGSWMVNGYACGMGIREDTRPITQNTSRFVPHVFAK